MNQREDIPSQPTFDDRVTTAIRTTKSIAMLNGVTLTDALLAKIYVQLQLIWRDMNNSK